MHGPGSTTMDVANEMVKINEILRSDMLFMGYAKAIRSEIGISADLIAEDFLASETPYRPTVTRYKLLKMVQGRVIAEIHQRYNIP